MGVETLSTPGVPAENVEPNTQHDGGKVLQIRNGVWSCIVCFAGFMINFSTGGLISSNGILLIGIIDLYDDTVSKTALVGSLFMGIAQCVGPIVLLLMMFNASHRQIIICGGFFSALSTFASFFAQKIEVLYITYGILTGCFVGMSSFTAKTIVASYFQKKRALAVGIAGSGTGVGAFVLNYLIERSISFYGMRGTFLLISGLLLNIIVYGALFRPLKIANSKNKKTKEINPESTETNLGFEPDEEISENNEHSNTNNPGVSELPEHSGYSPSTSMKKRVKEKCSNLQLAIFDANILKNSGMQLLIAIYLLRAASQMILIYLPMKTVNSGLDREQGALVISIYGAVYALSQMIVGVLSDLLHIPTSYLLMFSLFGMSATSVGFIFCHNFPAFVQCAVIYAISKGFSGALKIVIIASTVGVENLAKGASPLTLFTGLAYIIYPIIAGALFDATQSFDSIFFLSSGSLFMASIISSGIIYMQRKRKFYE